MEITVKFAKNNFLMNSFSIELMKNVSVSLKNIEKMKGFKIGENNHHLLSEADKYHSRVFRIQSALSKTAEQLSQIRIFLNRYPLRRYYFEKGISQLEYIQYHTEVLFHKVHTILEIMKLLINEVYQLDIAPKDCSWITLTKKISRKTGPMKNLDLYYKTFEDLIDRRHSNTHRGHYEDQEKDDIDLKYGLAFYRLEMEGHRIDEEMKDSLSMPLINQMLREHKKKRVELIDTCMKENERLLTAFLESLFDEYQKQILNKLYN
jgi:hypothetical protein